MITIEILEKNSLIVVFTSFVRFDDLTENAEINFGIFVETKYAKSVTVDDPFFICIHIFCFKLAQ